MPRGTGQQAHATASDPGQALVCTVVDREAGEEEKDASSTDAAIWEQKRMLVNLFWLMPYFQLGYVVPILCLKNSSI